MSKEGETIRSIAARGLPMVIVDQPLIPKVPFVGIDNRLAARSCGQHLKDLGHQDFAIVTFPLGSDGHCGLVDRKVFHRVEAGAFPEGLTLRARTPETRDRTVFFEVDRPSCSFETSVQHPPERVTVHGNTIPVTRERVINANYFFGWQSKKCYKGDLDFVDASSCLVEEIQGTRNDSSAGSRPGRQARGGTLSFWPT